MNTLKRLDRLENTAKKLAMLHGVSARTINNDEKFKNTVVVFPEDEQQAVLSGKKKLQTEITSGGTQKGRSSRFVKYPGVQSLRGYNKKDGHTRK